MNDGICKAIAKLRADAAGVEFTGFITNAHATHPPVLEGEIWHHLRAESSGRFADGHRIQTSSIIEIHVRGESIWVDTENGGRYGIASFAPLGWVYFSDLCRAYERLDPVPVEAPIFDLHHSCHSQIPVGSEVLGKVNERRLKQQRKEPESRVTNPKPSRPTTSPNFLKQMTEHARDSIETLKRNGVNVIKHDK
ncbi:hypothetical protein [Pseudomonas sp. PD9R]|uniref:hypothetical protein n=1 Tax=Pseudomonas sp. PD9R TaxID=2853534 RepID=UPI001C44DB7E|nr:hypothetical protein [Pseudomonas sp. PD9R]MBV6822811.1 hypothetical protein [Pseudomonas sp. PD9R]